MSRIIAASVAAAVLALGAIARRAIRAGPELASTRRSAEDAERRLRRRSRRRRREFEGPDLRLHAHRPSLRHARRQSDLRARRFAAVRVRSRPASSCASWGQDVYGFNAAIGLRVDPAGQRLDDRRRGEPGREVRSRRSIALVLGRKPEAIDVRPAAARRRPRRGAVEAPAGAQAAVAAGAAAAGGGGGGGGRGNARRRHARVGFSRPTDVAWDQGRQHLRRRRHRHQQPHRQVRQGRQVHHALGIDRQRRRASSTA